VMEGLQFFEIIESTGVSLLSEDFHVFCIDFYAFCIGFHLNPL